MLFIFSRIFHIRGGWIKEVKMHRKIYIDRTKLRCCLGIEKLYNQWNPSKIIWHSARALWNINHTLDCNNPNRARFFKSELKKINKHHPNSSTSFQYSDIFPKSHNHITKINAENSKYHVSPELNKVSE